MDVFVEAIKRYLIPGSLSFLLITITIACFFMAGRTAAWQRRGRRLLIAVAVAYWVFSLPLTSQWLQGTVAVDRTAIDRCLSGDDCALVILGSGIQTYRSGTDAISAPMNQTAWNGLRGLELGRRSAGPIVVSGGAAAEGAPSEGAVLADLLIRHGIAPSRILVDDQSHTTREQAERIAALLESRHISRVVLVSAPAHLRRAVPTFRACGLTAFGYAAEIRELDARWTAVVPSLGGFTMARDAIYEYFAFGYYLMRGWLAR